MDTGRLRHLDLNLLLALDALLDERNVSRAARRLGVSQPSVSGSLARLRRHFGDELLQRRGNQYQLTILGAQLAARIPAALAGVQRVFDTAPDFDPAVAEREFTLMVSDYAAAILGEPLTELAVRQAPNVRFRLLQNTPAAVDNIDDTLRAFDGLVMPHGILSDLPVTDLYEDSWVCVVAEDNAMVGDVLTLDDLAALPWVVTYHGPTAYTPALRQLQMIGVDLWDHQRHRRVLPVVLRVADDEVARVRKRGLDLAGNRRVESRKHDLRRVTGRRGLDDELCDVVGQRRRQPPRGCVAVRLALRSLARAKPRHLEPWVLRQQCDELLADRPCCSENSDVNSSHRLHVLRA